MRANLGLFNIIGDRGVFEVKRFNWIFWRFGAVRMKMFLELEEISGILKRKTCSL